MTWMSLGWPGLGAVLAAMTLLWLISLAVRDASIVDQFWGPGFVGLVWLYAWLGLANPRGFIVAAMVTAWGLRLFAYIAVRNWGEGEDRRYVQMRESWGSSFWWASLFQVFLLQGVIMWIVAFPLLVVHTDSEPAVFTAFDVIGLVAWAAGLAVETVADLQMARFKADPDSRGKVMDRGVWRYSRHPNYFGEALLWWGIFTVACSVTGGWWTVFSPTLMTFLLLKVSGVAMLEKDIKKRRPKYQDYIERTSAFIPWPPKKAS